MLIKKNNNADCTLYITHSLFIHKLRYQNKTFLIEEVKRTETSSFWWIFSLTLFNTLSKNLNHKFYEVAEAGKGKEKLNENESIEKGPLRKVEIKLQNTISNNYTLH